MDEYIQKEIAKAAEVLEMEVSEVEAKWLDICDKNNITADESKLGLSLFRQWFSGMNALKEQDVAPAATGGGGNDFIKEAYGFFISAEAARDMGKWQNDRVKGEYDAAPQATYEAGKVAIVTQVQDGFEAKRMDAEEGEKIGILKELPENNFGVDLDTWIVPLHDRHAWANGDKNPMYGKPLPHAQWMMAGVFVGEVAGETGTYFFSYKGDACKEFTPETFKLVTVPCIKDRNYGNRIYGFKRGTLEGLKYEEDTDKQPSITDMQNYVMEHASGNYSALLNLNRYHTQMQSSGKRSPERFVITDGSVSSINMTPNSFGTRRMTVTDINADFDYEGGSWAGTTCWVPEHLGIDFGIGSSVVVVGRTSQRKNDDGSWGDVSLNVSGILCTENRGVAVEPFEAQEEDLDWF